MNTMDTMKKIDVEAATTVVSVVKTDDATKKRAKWVALGALGIVTILAAILVPTMILTLAPPPAAKAVAVTIDVHFPGQAGSHRTVDAMVNLPKGLGAKPQWHLMTTSKGANPVTPEDDEHCVHVLHTGGKSYLFKSDSCTYPPTDVTDCSVRDAADPLPAAMKKGAAMGVEALLTRNTSSGALKVASAGAVVQGEADPFAPPAVCVAKEQAEKSEADAVKSMSLGDHLVYDVRTTALLSVTGETTRADIANELEKSDPEAWWWLAIPCRGGTGKDYWVGQREYEYRTHYKTPTTTSGNNCEYETQSRWRVCTGQFSLWAGWEPWSGTFQHEDCTCQSDHILKMKPNGYAVREGQPFIASDARCVEASTSASVTQSVSSSLSVKTSQTLSTSTATSTTLSVGGSVGVTFAVVEASVSLEASFGSTVTNGQSETSEQSISSSDSCSVTIPPGGNTHFLKFTAQRQRYKQPVKIQYRQCAAHGQFGAATWIDGEVMADHVQSQGECEASMECAAVASNPSQTCRIDRFDQQRTSSSEAQRDAASGCKSFAPGTAWADHVVLTDKSEQCPYWGGMGYCKHSFVHYMTANCALTCSKY